MFRKIFFRKKGKKIQYDLNKDNFPKHVHVSLSSDYVRYPKIEDIISDMTVKLDPVQKKKVLVITDRSQAIKTACTLASEGDIVILAGKGHEKYQEIEGVKHYFDDVEELVESLNINQ